MLQNAMARFTFFMNVRPLTGWNLTGKSPLSSIPETPSNQVVLPTATLTDVD